jgi:hypothetical protein
MLVAMLLLPVTSVSSNFESWTAGDEVAITGHSFDEEYWTASSFTNETADGHTVNFSLSYVNAMGVKAFLMALNTIEKNNDTGSIPYQLFGMKYFSPKGEEVFIGATFAFLMAYVDENNNSIQDPGNEQTYYLIPFGATLDQNYTPSTEVQEVEKLGPGHYRLGITYRNMYAKVVEGKDNLLGFLASLLLPLYTAQFSELSFRYDIKINEATGVATVETFYTIGQVLNIWQWTPFQPEPFTAVDVNTILNDSWGISAVHYVNVFTSNYVVEDETGTTVDTNIDQNMTKDIQIKIGNDERAFQIGYRGTYDLINETSGATVESGLDALNIMVGARLGDHILVLWQLGFSAAAFSVFAYGLSDHIQAHYASPKALAQDSLKPLNQKGFRRAALWYAVSFPGWNGFRVEHDPVYTAYFGHEVEGEPEEPVPGPSGGALLIGIGLMAMAVYVRRGKKKDE